MKISLSKIACSSLVKSLGVAFITTISVPLITNQATAATFAPTPFESLTIDSTTPLTRVFSNSLETGVTYRFEASGQFTPDTRVSNWDVDARFIKKMGLKPCPLGRLYGRISL